MDCLSFRQEMLQASRWSEWRWQKKVVPLNGGKQVCGIFIARERDLRWGLQGEERRSIVQRQAVVLSSVDMVTHHKVLFHCSGWNENALFIHRSLIMNPPNAGWEVWSVEVKAFLLRIHITYFIWLVDLGFLTSSLWFRRVMAVITKKNKGNTHIFKEFTNSK